MKHISTTEARSALSDLVSQVEFGKETIVLTRRNRDVAALVPLEALKILTAIFDELEDYPEHPDNPSHARVRYAALREKLGIADRETDARRGAALITADRE